MSRAKVTYERVARRSYTGRLQKQTTYMYIKNCQEFSNICDVSCKSYVASRSYTVRLQKQTTHVLKNTCI